MKRHLSVFLTLSFDLQEAWALLQPPCSLIDGRLMASNANGFSLFLNTMP